MTKEEILKKHTPDLKHEHSGVRILAASSAMEEYAEDKSIDFLTWYLESEWNFCDIDHGTINFIKGNIDNPDACEFCTSKQLYQLYLNSKTT